MRMRAVITYVGLTTAVVMSGTAQAQVSKTLNGEAKVVTATVEAIERQSRQITLKNTDGTYEILDVPASAKRLKEPGEKPVDSATGATTPTPGGTKPAGTMATQRTITATITAIDPKVPSISFTGPNGWAYSTRVEEKNNLDKVKVGDKVDITWTSAALIAFEE